MGHSIIKSFMQNGFTDAGYFFDFVNFKHGMPQSKDVKHSIRQQSEAVYAMLHYLKYERQHGRQHKEWEKKMRTVLDNFLTLQKADGSFARKYNDAGADIDASGGSTPSATSTLVMGWKFFGDKRYLAAAKRTVEYVERNIISKSDYFSSTLDANCEDKEAAIAAVTSTYYLAMVTKGKERAHYIALCKRLPILPCRGTTPGTCPSHRARCWATSTSSRVAGATYRLKTTISMCSCSSCPTL